MNEPRSVLGIVDDCNHWELRARNTFYEHLIFRFPFLTYFYPPSPPPPFSPLFASPPMVTLHRPVSQGEHGKGSTPLPFGQMPTKEVEVGGKAVSGDQSSSWPLPDLNKQVSSLLESSKTILPLPEFIDPRPSSPSKDSSGASSSSRPGPSSPPSSSAKETADNQKQKAFLESQFSAALSILGRLVPGFGGDKKLGGSEGKPVDKARRVREEGEAEKFDIERFYRAVMLQCV